MKFRGVVLCCLLVVAGYSAATSVGGTGSENAAAAPAGVDATARGVVLKVIDGDTLDVRVAGKRDRIRVLGIDAPEMSPRERCASQARDAVTRLALGKLVTLVPDSTQAARDRFKRRLVYITLPGGADLGRSLLVSGYARVFVFNGRPFLRVRPYRAAEAAARSKAFGVWGSCSGTTVIPVPVPRPAPPPAPPGTTTAPTGTLTPVAPTVPATPPSTGTTTTAATTTGTTTTTPTTTGTTTTTTTTPQPGCHASYPDFCIPPPPPDKDCGDFAQKNFRVLHNVANPDPHRLDGNQDGRGCES